MTPKPEYGRSAGRELDAEIATRVFGLTVRRHHTGWWLTNDPEGHALLALRFYSVRMRDATHVLDVMRSRGVWLPFDHSAAAPLRICLAALSALDSLTTETEK